VSSADQKIEARQKVVFVNLWQGLLGVTMLALVTALRHDEVPEIVEQLGEGALLLIAIFFVYSIALQLLKFELTDRVFVSLSITAYIAMYPLVGVVVSAWIAVLAPVIARYLGLRQIGPVKIPPGDAKLEYLTLFRLTSTYGVPVILAAFVYELLGGTFPLGDTSIESVLRLAVSGLVVILANTLLMERVMSSYGYDASKRIKLNLIDSSIYLLVLPSSICMTMVHVAIGWGAVVALAFTGIIANLVARNLAVTRSESRHQLQRLASLSNIGKAISLRFTTEQLLMALYTECRKVVDVSLFSIALLDESNGELSFELDVRDDVVLPKERIPLGEGLNSWVVQHHRPLLLGSVREERRLGLTAIDDGKPTESWLGVPMIARDRVIGVISVQSQRKHAFTSDDVLLMTSIANQAAVALENAHLYKDLEGLTFALEQRVLDRTNELREANLRLMAADRSKNQFLANMSHELRTPLNSVIGFSSVLLDNTRESLQPRLYKFLENIRTAGNHLLELINDILDLSKIEAGKMELNPESFDLRATIAAVERVMRGLSEELRVRIVSKIDPAVPRVRLDEGRLKQILFNLLSNAVKFSHPGGVVSVAIVPVPRERSPIGLPSIRIDVEDEGIGIAPDQLEKIFDEFYQADEARKGRNRGTGLGLSLTRNFVEMHGGVIEVNSQRGKGSRFRIHLPVDYGEVNPVVAVPVVQPPSAVSH
jgi:signal transduction histidine kinase